MKNIIVLFGGSFNPPLNSHFSIAQNVLNQFKKVSKIVFVPVNQKYSKNGLLENEHRYNMLKLVSDKNESFEVSSIDFDSDSSLYLFEQLEEIQETFPDNELWFLIGSDNLKEINKWKKPEILLSKYKCIVMERDTDNIETIIENDDFLREHKDNIIKLNQEIRSNYSSTYVRQLIKNNKSIRYLVPDEVYEYIEKNNLYRM